MGMRRFLIQEDMMESFFYKEPYEENGKTVPEVNLFPGKYCNFNCIFCPVSRKLPHQQTQDPVDMGNLDAAIRDLQQKIRAVKPDLVFINSLGEALLLVGLEQVIRVIHEENVPVRLLSNGYLYGNPKYAALAGTCEEVIGELKMGREEAFRKAQRPLAGYTVRQHIENMAAFRKSYPGRFHLEITVVRGYSDDPASLRVFRDAVAAIGPDVLQVVTPEAPFDKVLGLSPTRLEAVAGELQKSLHA